ncbi:group II intron reverse transcriptase/maturase [Cytobacillus sp. Bac17]|uniref:group II intron reverse transcriptase/maturase n=1 Tax=Cytobacillus sp. Bac17 TaxID=2926008 RepID=UPI0021191479|nr:group II intron reverse transcriptase/maturase [Cytobacillus sp. Bac17]
METNHVGVKQLIHSRPSISKKGVDRVKVKACSVSTEKDLQNTLDEMHALAKENKEPFYNLVELMCNEQTIMTAIHNIKSNKGSKTAGIDGKTIDDYLQKPYEELMQEIKNSIQNYNPLPVKRKRIPKENSNKLRPLGIPVVLDRIIQEVTRIVIEPIAEAKFFKHSFGFRPMRDAKQAMAEVLDRINRSQTYWVIEGDIEGFFDNINHNKLITMLWEIGIKDKRILSIIKKMLKSGIFEEDGKLYPSEKGSPQGGIISPLLANIYLNHFDWMIAKKYLHHPSAEDPKHKHRSHGLKYVRKRHERVILVRYADDWVIFCETKEKATKCLNEITKYFKHRLSLNLSEEKTLITNIRERRAKFLGFEFFAEKSHTSKKIVGKLIPNIKKTNEKVRRIKKEIRKLASNHKMKAEDRGLQIEKINSIIVGLAEYYSIANCSNFFKAWDGRLAFQTHKTFKRINGGKGRWKSLTMRANELDNRITRHEKRRDRLYYLKIHGVKIGITKFSFTPSTKALRASDTLSPYTAEGRKKYENKTDKKLPLLRMGTIFEYEELKLRIANMHQNPKRLYNFEYVMNKEYAYIRDKGKCKCCGLTLWSNYQCHHINSILPINKVNKVSNLASVCYRCHKLIHSHEEPRKYVDEKASKKILKYRNVRINKMGRVK